MIRGWKLVSGGTDTHLLLVDLRDTDLSGKDAEEFLGRADITVNKNTVPGETRSPFVTSGLRIGTPALTSRGMGPSEMRLVAQYIDDAVRHAGDAAFLRRRQVGKGIGGGAVDGDDGVGLAVGH